MTTYWSKVPQRHLYSSIDLIFDMLRNSRFEKIGIDKERLVICEELNMIYDNPENRVEYLMDKLLWPNHPLGNEIAGTKNTVMNMTIDEMIQLAGGKNLGADLSSPWPMFSLEELLKKQPEVLLVSTEAGEPSALAEKIRTMSQGDVWSQIKAIKNNRIYSWNICYFRII